MVREGCNKHVFHHPWSNVSLASFCKYPNPHCPDVVSADIIHRYVHPSTGRLHTTRLITVQSPIPAFLNFVTNGNNKCYTIEESVVDAKQKIMVMKSHNLNFNNILSVNETCMYKEDSTNPNQTLFEQNIKFRATALGLGGTIENILVEKFKENTPKGRIAIDVIASWIGEGIDDLKLGWIKLAGTAAGSVATSTSA